MDANQFDSLTRALTAAGSRRQALAGLGGILAGLLGQEASKADGSGAFVGGGGKRHHRGKGDSNHHRDHDRDKDKDKDRCHHKCGACERCKRGTCKPKSNGTACGDGGSCKKGRCIAAAPAAAAAPCTGVVCGSGETCCPKTGCTNLASDEANCGACDAPCGNGEVCCDGTCAAVGCFAGTCRPDNAGTCIGGPENLVPCNAPNPQCFCSVSPNETQTICADFAIPCSTLVPCPLGQSQCTVPGTICAKETCCETPVCEFPCAPAPAGQAVVSTAPASAVTPRIR